MIPKIIHFCWLSGEPYPEEIQKCIDTWKVKLPDYSFMLWDLSKVDVNVCNWTKQAFEKKKYAFVSDYVRFYALYNYGGIYLDSDVEIIKPFDNLLNQDFFFCFEYTTIPEAAVIGAKKGLPWFKACIDWYLNNNFLEENGKVRQIVAPLVLKYGFETTLKTRLIDTGEVQIIQGGTVYPFDYFSAWHYYTGKKLITENTYSVHHFFSAWLNINFKVKAKRLLHVLLIKLLGKRSYNKAKYKLRNVSYNQLTGIDF